MIQIETERKFLIRMPNIALISELNGVRIKKIEQTYLLDSSCNARVRKIEENLKITYIKTTKKRISTLSVYEDECEIDEQRYQDELTHKDESKNTVFKTRYCIPFGDHILEIDVYPFWNDRAVLEIELANENECFSLPEFISVIKEVSDDPRYKNTRLAKQIPMDII